MNERPDGDQSPGLVWLRIGIATVVVIGLVVLTGALDDSGSDSGTGTVDGRSMSDTVTRCGDREARRVARIWFRGMSSGKAARIEAVTSRGAPVPRYVISVQRGGGARTVRVRTRGSAASVVPALTDNSDDLRLFGVRRVVRPPKTADPGSTLSGRLAGIEFTARVGKTTWSGKTGLRCGSETAYFAALLVSDGRALPPPASGS